MDPQRFPKYLQLGPWSLPKSFYLFHVLVTMITKDYNYFSYFQSMLPHLINFLQWSLAFSPFQSPKISYQDGGSLDLLRFVQPKTSMVIIALISNVFNWRMDHLFFLIIYFSTYPPQMDIPAPSIYGQLVNFFCNFNDFFFWQIISQSYP